MIYEPEELSTNHKEKMDEMVEKLNKIAPIGECKKFTGPAGDIPYLRN